MPPYYKMIVAAAGSGCHLGGRVTISGCSEGSSGCPVFSKASAGWVDPLPVHHISGQVDLGSCALMVLRESPGESHMDGIFFSPEDFSALC